MTVNELILELQKMRKIGAGDLEATVKSVADSLAVVVDRVVMRKADTSDDLIVVLLSENEYVPG